MTYSNYLVETQIDSGVSDSSVHVSLLDGLGKCRFLDPTRPPALHHPELLIQLGRGPRFCNTKMLPSGAGPTSRLSTLDLCSSKYGSQPQSSKSSSGSTGELVRGTEPVPPPPESDFAL